MMPPALFLSPHLDDVAFSCGGTLHALAAAGWECVLVTLFTKSVPRPTGFALECQTSKGLAADVDYMHLRRLEDAAAAVHLNCAGVHWGALPEAPHRGYESAAELFATRRTDDALDPVAALVDDLIRRFRPGLVFAPQSWGRHVDHTLVTEAVAGRRPTGLVWYFDTPYVLRDDPVPPPESLRPSDAAEVAVDIAGSVAAKLDACAAYRSQLGFQFGDEATMRTRLAADRERLLVTDPARERMGGSVQFLLREPR